MICTRKYIGCIGTDNCPICLRMVDPRYKKVKEILLLPHDLRPCIHLGEETGEKVICPTCSPEKEGKIKLKVFECNIYDSCTIGRKVPGIACCNGCKDYVPSQSKSQSESHPLSA